MSERIPRKLVIFIGEEAEWPGWGSKLRTLLDDDVQFSTLENKAPDLEIVREVRHSSDITVWVLDTGGPIWRSYLEKSSAPDPENDGIMVYFGIKSQNETGENLNRFFSKLLPWNVTPEDMAEEIHRVISRIEKLRME